MSADDIVRRWKEHLGELNLPVYQVRQVMELPDEIFVNLALRAQTDGMRTAAAALLDDVQRVSARFDAFLDGLGSKPIQ